MSVRSIAVMSCPCTISRPWTVTLLVLCTVVLCSTWRRDWHVAECWTLNGASMLNFSVSPM